MISESKNKNDKVNDSPADDNSGQKEVIPQNDINQQEGEKGETVTENNTQKKDVKNKANNASSNRLIPKSETESTTFSVSKPSQFATFTTDAKGFTKTSLLDKHYSTLDILVDQTEREEGRDYMRYENMKTTLTTQTSKSRATSKISNPTTESFDAIHSKSRDGELTNETGVSVNLLHQEDLDRDNEITTEVSCLFLLIEFSWAKY